MWSPKSCVQQYNLVYNIVAIGSFPDEILRVSPLDSFLLSGQSPGLLDTAAPDPTSSATASTLKPQSSASTKVIQRKGPRPLLITTSAYRATRQTLEKILHKRLISCTHGAAHEDKERKAGWCWCKAGGDKQEAEVCDDPDCEPIWYHETCLKQGAQGFCGRFSKCTYPGVLAASPVLTHPRSLDVQLLPQKKASTRQSDERTGSSRPGDNFRHSSGSS